MRADRVCGKRPLFPKSYATPLAVRAYATRSLLHKALGRVGWTTDAPLPPQPAIAAPYRLAMKSIESLGRAGLLAACIPEARFVHIVRHPCGYVASVLRGEQQKRFGHNEAASDFELYRLACETGTGAPSRHHDRDDQGVDPGRATGLALADLQREGTRRTRWRSARDDALLRAAVRAACRERTRALCAVSSSTGTSRRSSSSSTARPRAASDYYSVFKDPLASAWRWQRELDAADAERVMAIVVRSPVARPYLEPRDWNRAA